MTHWRQSRLTDLGLRALGAVLCGGAAWAISILYALRQAGASEEPDFACFGLAMIAFLAASAGAALISIGRHVFDTIELPARYHRTNFLPDIDKE